MRWSIIPCLLLVALPVCALPRPYLAVFTFAQGQWDQITDDQLRILQASPYDGMATWLRGGYDVAPGPELAELQPKIQQFRQQTSKDLWPFVFLNRIIQQEAEGSEHTGAKHDPAFAAIKGMDLDNETGALTSLLLDWRRTLQLARALESPGLGIDMEFYNNYPLEDVATLAKRRGEPAEVTRQKLRAVGAKLADLVAAEYPQAVIWSLFTRLARRQDIIGGPPMSTSSSGCISEGLLQRAEERKIPLTLIDGSEDAVGYLNRSLDDLKGKLVQQQDDNAEWTRAYPQLQLGATIAPWLDLQHRAYWMKDTPVVNDIEGFLPFFTLLLQQRGFVWVYGAGTAYNVWQEPYATRFAAVLSQAREQALHGPRLPMPEVRTATYKPPTHVTPALGDVLADLTRSAVESGVRLSEMNAPEGVRQVELKPNKHEVGGAAFVADFIVPAWTGGKEWQWPGMSLPLAGHTDWSAYQGLAVEVYNPSTEPAEIGVSLVDANKGEWYRYYLIAPQRGGVVFVPASEMRKTMDVSQVKGASLLMRRPPVKTTFYLSEVVLVK